MADIETLNDVAESSGGTNTSNQPTKKYGIYRAICVDPKDPGKSGKVKVNIPALGIGTIKDSDGIWALPCTTMAAPNLEVQKVNDCGSLFIPQKDTLVFVFFEDGDISKPRYFGGVVLEGGIPTENRSGDQYWNKHMVAKTVDKRMIFLSDDNSSDAGIIIRGKV